MFEVGGKMQEQIGKIILDKKYYPGVDLYCDGVIEDEILDIVKNTPSGDYRKVIEERVVEITSRKELDEKDVKGKIVFFNVL